MSNLSRRSKILSSCFYRRDEEERIRKEQEDFEAQIAALQSQIPAIEVPPEPVDAEEVDPEPVDSEPEEEEEEAPEEGEEQEEEPVMEVSVVQEEVSVRVEPEEPVEEEVVDEDESVVSIQQLSRPTTAAERRIQQLLRNLEDGYLLHASHPRRMRNGKFFIPQVFHEDIYFNPFGAVCHGQMEEEGEAGGESTSQPANNLDSSQDLLTSKQMQDPFWDIKQTVKNYKKQLEKSRKLLFSTSSDDVPAKDCMLMYRTG